MIGISNQWPPKKYSVQYRENKMKALFILFAIVLGLIGIGIISGNVLLGLILIGSACAILVACLSHKIEQIKLKFSSIGNLDAVCPYCNQHLEKKPGKKKKCPFCQQYIYIRTRPSDKQQVLVTEDQAEQIEEQWSIVNGTHGDFLAEKKRFAKETTRLANRFRREPSDDDVQLSLLNQELIEHTKQQDWGHFRNVKFAMADIYRRADKLTDALGLYLEVCYLDLNGPNNMGGLTDQELLREFPPWNPKDPTADLAPGVLERICRIINNANMDVGKVKDIYFNHASPMYDSLQLPITPLVAWKKINKELL